MQPRLTATILIATLAACTPFRGRAQEVPSSPLPKVAPDAQQTASSAPARTTLRLTLEEALNLARKNNTQFQAALTEAGLAREDRVQARSTLLPGVGFTTSALYTPTNIINAKNHKNP